MHTTIHTYNHTTIHTYIHTYIQVGRYLDALCQTQHVHGPFSARLDGLDRVVLVVRWGCWAG